MSRFNIYLSVFVVLGISAMVTIKIYKDQSNASNAGIYAQLSTGKNIFNKNASDTEYLRYIKDTDGSSAQNVNYNATGYIPIEPNSPYTLSFGHMIAWYDKKKSFISGDNLSEKSKSVTSPNGAAFLRATVAVPLWEAFQIERGNVHTEFEPFHYIISDHDGAKVLTDRGSDENREAPKQKNAIFTSKYYATPGNEISLYRENVFNNYRNIHESSAITIENGKETSNASSIIPSEKNIKSPIKISLEIATKQFNQEYYSTSEIVVSAENNKRPLSIINIGDSLTTRSGFVNVMMNSVAYKGISFIGNRDSTKTSPAVQNEGQGGWSMQAFNTVDYNGYLSPFMQPIDGDMLYFGRAEFWVDANSSSPSYNAAGFKRTKNLFDPITGLLKNPKPGYLMSKDDNYILWDGKRWNIAKNISSYSFRFDFSKYRKAWNVPSPDVVHILIGTNDFSSITGSDFQNEYSSYKKNYDTMMASIKKDSPNAKIIVGTPISAARQGALGTLTSERANNAYKLLAENLISDYDNKQADGIYVNDYHAVVDRVNGFDRSQENYVTNSVTPISDYYVPDITHPSSYGSDQMGNLYLGLIQYLRTK
jgi:lysophospholipase L1-like esterase